MGHGLLARKRAVAQALFERRTFDELHRYVEIIAVGAELEDVRHHAMERCKLLLKDRAAPLGGYRIRVVLTMAEDQLQRGHSAVAAATRPEDRAELAAADGLLGDDLEVVAGHQRAPSGIRCGGAAGTMRFPASRSARCAGATPSMMPIPKPAKTLPRRTRWADGLTEIAASAEADVRVRMEFTNVACPSSGTATSLLVTVKRLPRTVTDDDGESRSAWRIGPAISTSSRVAAGAVMRTPISVGASDSIRTPATRTLRPPVIDSAGDGASAGRTIVTVSGTRATRSMPSRTSTASRYTPGSTRTTSPGLAAARAAPMVRNEDVPSGPTNSIRDAGTWLRATYAVRAR